MGDPMLAHHPSGGGKDWVANSGPTFSGSRKLRPAGLSCRQSAHAMPRGVGGILRRLKAACGGLRRRWPSA
eukprot:579429-Alexandrium_andersonii.AAC.1